MALLRVVEEFDVIKDVSPGCLLNGVNLAANPLPFEELEETLDVGVVVTIAALSHAGRLSSRLSGLECVNQCHAVCQRVYARRNLTRKRL